MKTTKLTSRIGLAITILMGIVINTRADNTLTYTKVDTDGNQGESQKMMIRSGKMRVDMPDGKNVMIFDSALDKVFILEVEAKRYLTMDPAIMKKMIGALTAMQAQLEAKLAAMPEAQRAQMKAMMNKVLGLDGAPAPEMKRMETGRKEKVGEYRADVIEVMEDGEKAAIYYMVDRRNLEVGEKEYATMNEFQAFFGKMMESLPGPLKQKMKVQMLMAEKDQLPAKATHYEDGAVKRTDQLTDVSSEDLDPDLFEVPADFQERELPIGPGGGLQ